MDNKSSLIRDSLDLGKMYPRISFGSSSILQDVAQTILNGTIQSRKTVAESIPEPSVQLDSVTTSTNSPTLANEKATSPDKLKFKKGFRDCLASDYSDYGTKSMAEVFVESWLNMGVFQVQLWLGEVYLENQSDPDTLMALLKVVMHVDPKDFAPVNRMVALASLSHSSLEVRECAVRCYEYWECPEFYTDLANRPLEPAWLEEYKNSFIN
ncbi:hypothetical protein GEV41_16020 [Pseudomonas putida]|uniref:hypothetical protein n=1 Tax=Pseudomonas putida TaxID=303 RepID=UPI0015711AD4|nr:hypothetical protein [Pseudomonas putida]QKL07865.1 hypothetical protein GEV41_16020 [Pseudomonas putida]